MRKKYRIKLLLAIVAIAVLFNFKCFGVADISTIIKVAVEPNMPPFQFMSEDKVVGMHIDILNSIAKKNNLIIEYVAYKNNTECIEALEKGKVDIILGVMRDYNIKYYAQMTEEISQSSICAIARADVARNIKNQISAETYNAVLEAGSIRYSFLNNMKNLRYTVVSNQIRAFETLIEKKANVLLGNKVSILYQLENAKLNEDYVIINNYMMPLNYCIIVNKIDEDLLKKLNAGIENLKISGEYEKIHNKWNNEKDYLIKETIEKAISIAILLGAIILLIFFITINLNRLLKKQVYEKTKELQKTNDDLKFQITQTRNYNELNTCIVENSPSGIIAIDNNYHINLFNQNASKITGIINSPIGEVVFNFKFFCDILLDKKNKIFSESDCFLNEEITLKGITYRYDIVKLYNSDDKVRGAVLTIEDITKEIRLKDQIYEKEKNKALNQIIVGIAHEIRNPLAAIKTFVELLPYKKDNSNFQEQIVEIVPKEVDRVNTLIKNLINYAKPDTGSKYRISIDEIIKSSIALVDNTIKNPYIQLITRLGKELYVIGDNNQLKQVIINFILNGFDAMEEKLKNSSSKEKLSMLIQTWESEEGVFVQISDEGVGMTDEEVRKSTNPFFTTKPTGTGLGMYISKQYVEQNGGILLIESEKNEYTKITIKFERLK